MQFTTEDSEKDINNIKKKGIFLLLFSAHSFMQKEFRYYINDLAYENTENYKLYPQISQIAQIK